MHKIASKPIDSLDNFEVGDYAHDLQLIDPQILGIRVDSFLNDLEQLRQLYLQYTEEAKNARTPEERKKCEATAKAYWKELIRWLPEGWKQTRTWSANYETLRSIYSQRKNHKLTEWHYICKKIETLPYAHELITQTGGIGEIVDI